MVELDIQLVVKSLTVLIKRVGIFISSRLNITQYSSYEALFHNYNIYPMGILFVQNNCKMTEKDAGISKVVYS